MVSMSEFCSILYLTGATQIKGMVSVFKALSGASNGILDRFCILVPDCRKLSEDLENETMMRLAELETGGVTVERIYELVADIDEDTVFTLITHGQGVCIF